MPLFELNKANTKAQDLAVLKKAKNPLKATTATKTSGGSIANKINSIKAIVETHLGKFKDTSEIINTEERLKEYIAKSISNGVISIDTETTGLDPLRDDIVGVCIYTPGEKEAYIPVGHISYVTGQMSRNQLSLDVVGRCMKCLEDAGIDIIMFNAVFDIRFIKNHLGVNLKCTWDCYLASRCLNENEPSKGLKKLYQKYILKGEEDAFKFDELFKGVNFAYVPITTAYLYAAHDAVITYEYYEYQKKYLRLDHERKDMRDIAWVFHNIEMPMVDVVVSMEDTGIDFDFEYNQKLKDKYHAILNEKEANFHKMCDMYSNEIELYDGKVRLDNPINIQSVPQLQALLYDIAKIEPVLDKKTKKPTRSTSEETLRKLKSPLADAILEYREFSTIVSTFIDKLPECVNPKDGRIHCKFNQYGADTGRMSSQDPNMQNLPSKNHDIRQMFKATDDEYVISTTTDSLEVENFTEVETPNGWKYSNTLKSGDELLITDDNGESVYSVESVKVIGNKVIINLYV